MTLAEQFGRRLRALRRRRGFTQAELALGAEMTTDGVQKIELGKRRPRIDTLLRLAAALDVDPCELVEGLRP